MFYSHTLLARKGPLGTVWCAAHVQHRLKKSQYTATNIPKTVELIIHPDVPLALRLYGDLLLGVVRIYSKKLDYLHHDWNLLNTWVAKAFVSSKVDLPEEARQAPPESVTLPEALNLDDFVLQDDTLDMEFDKHTRSDEDITLTDQIPTGIDPYVAVTFDEDIMSGPMPMDVDPHMGGTEADVEMTYEARPDIEPRDPRSNVRDQFTEVEVLRQRNLTGELNPDTERVQTNTPETVPEIEIRRDAVRDLSPVPPQPFASEQENVRVVPTEYFGEPSNGKDLPSGEEVLHTRMDTVFELRSGSPSPARSEEERDHFQVHPSPDIGLQPSPPPAPQVRPRKRKYFDKVTVLTNRILKERLEDPSDICHKRNKIPSSHVNVWRLNNQSKKDQTFNEPLLTGFSDDLRNVFEKDYIAKKPHLAVPVETIPEPAPVSSPTRDAEKEMNPVPPIPEPVVSDSTTPDITVQQSQEQQTEDVQEVVGSPSARRESLVTRAQSPHTFNNDDMGIEHLRDAPPSTSTVHEDMPELRHLGLTPVGEMPDEELYFLEANGNTPVRSPASQDPDALTERTRGLARYLQQRSSSSSPTSTEDLSLNKILEGKTRKIAARMFFETLVLKSRGLIDMQQKEPYGDISLKLLPDLFSKVPL